MANGTDYVGAVLDRLEQLCDACIDRARKLALEDGAILQEQVTQARKRLRGTDGISFPVRQPLAERDGNAAAGDDVPRKIREGAAGPSSQPVASRDRTPADLLCEAQAITYDFSFKDLQRELKSRGIKAVGKKHELKERLDKALAQELGTEQAAAHEIETGEMEAQEVEQTEKSATKTTAEPGSVHQEPPRAEDMAITNFPVEESAKSAEPSAELSTDTVLSTSEPNPTAPSSKPEPLKVGLLKWLPQTLGILAATVPSAASVPDAAPIASPASAMVSAAAPVAAPVSAQVAAPASAEAPAVAPGAALTAAPALMVAPAVAPSAAPAPVASPSDVPAAPAVVAPSGTSLTMPVLTLAGAPTAEPETIPAPAGAPNDTESGNEGVAKSKVRQVIAMHEASAHRQQQPCSKQPRSATTAVDMPKEGTGRAPALAPVVGQQAQSVKLNSAGIGGRVERDRLEEVRARQEKERELKREQQLNKERVQQERLIAEKKRKEAEEALKKAAAIKRHEEAEARRRLKEDEERRRLHALAVGKIPVHAAPAPASGLSAAAPDVAAVAERIDAESRARENAPAARSQTPANPSQPYSAVNRLTPAAPVPATRDVPQGVPAAPIHHVPSTHVMPMGLASSAAALAHNATGGRPAPARPASPPAETYEISDHEGSTDDEEDDSHANKYVPAWACGANLREALKKQADQDPSQIFNISDSSCDLDSIFRNGKSFKKRTSSQNWGQDLSTYTERQRYRVEMGFTPPKT